MHSYLKTIIFIILFSFISFLESSGGLNLSFAEDASKYLSSIPNLSNDQINLSNTLLAVSKDWDEKVDQKFFKTSIEALVEEAQQLIKKKPQPTGVVDALRKIIHQKFGYKYTNELDQQGIPINPNELFMHGLFETQKGYCMTLSLIYLIAAEQLGQPIFGVALPNHFFARYESDDIRINIEATEGGIPLPDDYYYDQFGINNNSPFFMKNLDKKQTLGAYFSNVGMAYYRQSLPKKAIFYLDLSTQINPRSMEARNNLGNIYSEQKEFQKAIEQYQAANEADPNNIATLFNLGIAFSDSGDSKNAAEAFLQVVQIDSSYIQAHRYLVQIFMQQKQYIKSLLHLKLISQLQKNNPRIFLAMADVYFQTKNFSLALESLKKVEYAFPDDPEFKSKLAEAFYRLGKYDSAIDQYRYLIEMKPEDLKSYIQLGWTHYRKGEIGLAIGWTKRGLIKGRGDQLFKTLGHMNLGLFSTLDEQFEEAKNWYQKALSVKKPNSLEGMVNDLKEAGQKFSNLAELDFFTGWLYKEFNENENAISFLQKYLTRVPNGKQASAARKALEDLGVTKISPINNEREIEGMTLIPSGFFFMGSDDKGIDERPKHKVFLDSYYIDIFELDAQVFADFLNQSPNPDSYYKNNKYSILEFGRTIKPKKGYEKFPINNVTWFGAKAYCQFVDKRLPTEAEWEKAARGIDGRTFPWGDEPPSPKISRFLQQWDEKKLDVMVPVDSMRMGKSPYRLENMAGNIKEWVDDWFDAEYYTSYKHQTNPKGPFGGEFKVLKGGSWHDLKGFLYSSFRNNSPPAIGLEDYGFRCAKGTDKESYPKKLIEWN
jgi:formylglycine-generating enzyme required for sulfatase activity/Tfp pilus assembly protein PilF